MKKKVSFVPKSETQKELRNVFQSMAERYGRYRVWSDFITMSACAISNVCDPRFRDEREQMYQSIVKRYTESEVDQMARMLALVTLALRENPEQDFLGETFSLLNLYDEWKGQFFTPYHVGAFMSAINMPDVSEQLQTKEYVTVNDCCCGAGCLLIAFANQAKNINEDFFKRIIFVAQDLDYTAAMMCYIQLTVLGCKAVVKVGNSLTDPFVYEDLDTDKVWYTPMYVRGGSEVAA